MSGTGSLLQRHTAAPAAPALAALARRALTDLPLGALLREAAPIVAGALGVPLVGIWQLLPGGGALCLGAGVGWAEGAVGRTTIAAAGSELEARALLGESPLVVHDLGNDPRRAPASVVAEQGAESAALLAIPGEAGAVGVLAAYDTRPRAFDATEVALLREVASVLGAAQRRRIAAAALRDAGDELELLLRNAAAKSAERPKKTSQFIGDAPDGAEYGTAESPRGELRASRWRALRLVGGRLAAPVGLEAAQARTLAEAREQATREVRRALSRELHDSLAQTLYSLALLAEVTARHFGRGDRAAVEEHLAQLGATARQATSELRLLIHELRVAPLEDETLADALARRLDAVERRAGLTTRLTVEGEAELSVATRSELFQIAQEALNNVLKHAGATCVAVTLRARDGALELSIADDGRGFAPARPNGGVGLASMRERAAGIGGAATIGPAAEGGTEVLVRLPLAPQRRATGELLAGVR